MKVKYIGDPNDNHSGPDVLNAFGQKFEKNKTVTISVSDEVAEKIAANSHFEVTPTKGDKNTVRSVADQTADADEAIVPSTTGDPETSSRETKVSIDKARRESPNAPMGEPG